MYLQAAMCTVLGSCIHRNVTLTEARDANLGYNVAILLHRSSNDSNDDRKNSNNYSNSFGNQNDTVDTKRSLHDPSILQYGYLRSYRIVSIHPLQPAYYPSFHVIFHFLFSLHVSIIGVKSVNPVPKTLYPS